MTYEDILAYYHDDIEQIAEDFNCSRQAIYQWRASVPTERQLQLEIITKGRLIADGKCFPSGSHPHK